MKTYKKNINPIEIITDVPLRGSGTFRYYKYWTANIRITTKKQLTEALRLGLLVKRQEKNWL